MKQQVLLVYNTAGHAGRCVFIKNQVSGVQTKPANSHLYYDSGSAPPLLTLNSAPLFLPSREISLNHLYSFSEAYQMQHLRGTPKFKVSELHVGKNSSSLVSCSDNREQGQAGICKVPWSPAGIDYTAVFKLT